MKRPCWLWDCVITKGEYFIFYIRNLFFFFYWGKRSFAGGCQSLRFNVLYKINVYMLYMIYMYNISMSNFKQLLKWKITTKNKKNILGSSGLNWFVLTTCNWCYFIAWLMKSTWRRKKEMKRANKKSIVFALSLPPTVQLVTKVTECFHLHSLRWQWLIILILYLYLLALEFGTHNLFGISDHHVKNHVDVVDTSWLQNMEQ